MDGLILVLIGLFIGWFIEMMLDYFYWRPRRLAADSEVARATLERQVAEWSVSVDRVPTLAAQLQAKDTVLEEVESTKAVLQSQVAELTQQAERPGELGGVVQVQPIQADEIDAAPAEAGEPVQELQPKQNDQPVVPATPTQVAKRRESLALVNRYVIGAVGIGIVPVPLLDFAALTVLQLQMITQLSKVYGVRFNASRGRSVITSVLVALLPASIGLWALSFVKFMPVVGYTAGIVGMSTVGGAVTYAVGKTFIRYFEQNRPLATLRTAEIKRDVETLVREGEEVVAELRRNSA